jgi:hypothetical protein
LLSQGQVDFDLLQLPRTTAQNNACKLPSACWMVSHDSVIQRALLRCAGRAAKVYHSAHACVHSMMVCAMHAIGCAIGKAVAPSRSTRFQQSEDHTVSAAVTV